MDRLSESRSLREVNGKVKAGTLDIVCRGLGPRDVPRTALRESTKGMWEKGGGRRGAFNQEPVQGPDRGAFREHKHAPWRQVFVMGPPRGGTTATERWLFESLGGGQKSPFSAPNPRKQPTPSLL